MSPVPFLLRGFAKWQRIKTDVDNWAREWDYPTYTEAPTLYRFSGWGFLHVPSKRYSPRAIR